MKRKNKLTIFTSIVLFFIVVGIIIVVLRTTESTDDSNSSEYYLCINGSYNEKVDTFWKCTIKNDSLLTLLDKESYYPVFKDSFRFQKGTTLELTFFIIEENDDSWWIEVEQWENDSEDSISSRFYISQEPETFVDGWIENWDDFSPILVPCDAIDYIYSVGDNIPDSKREFIQVEDLKILEDYSAVGNHSKNILVYNDVGILQCYRLYYDDQKTFEMILTDYEIYEMYVDPPYIFIWSILFSNIILAVILLTFVSVIIYASKKKQKMSKTSPKQISTKTEKPLPKNKAANRYSEIFTVVIVLFMVSFLFPLLFPVSLFMFSIWVILAISAPKSRNRGRKALNNKSDKQDASKTTVKEPARCSTCGGELADQAIFCHRCGKSIYTKLRYCSYCGLGLMEDAAFCHRCGNLTQGAFDLPVPIKSSKYNTARINSTNKSNKLCTKCGSEMKWEHFYCQNCGNKF